jgi:ribosomal protein S18 acetylase RimI-like enzyme
VGVVELHDRDAIAAFCRRRAAVHAYELGDLDDFFWPHTRWFAWERDGEPAQLALLYTEHELPVLLALAEEPVEEMGRLLVELLRRLPARLYAHVSPSLAGVLQRRYTIEPHGPHLKMALARPELLDGRASPDAVLLGPDDLQELELLYSAAYPGTWFVPRMLKSGRYVGLRVGGRLACVAGVHVWSTRWGVAALGNVATLPELRGRGLAQVACAALCTVLLADGIETIALNVHAGNAPAIAAYCRLGFETVAEYEEVLLEAA